MIIDNSKVLERAGLPPKRKFSERLKYAAAIVQIMDEAKRGSGGNPESYDGLIRLQCAMAGIDLVPYNSIDIMDRQTHWTYIQMGDKEQYWLVPREGFYDLTR